VGARLRLLDWQRKHTVDGYSGRGSRQAWCLARAVSREVGVSIGRADERLVLGNVQRCGRPTCVFCSAIIAAARRDEIRDAVAAWRASGGEVYMLTLTVPHHRGNSLDLLLDRKSALWSRTASGGWWRGFREEHGIRGLCRVLETKHNDDPEDGNGWHPHDHVLLFCDAGADLIDIRVGFFARYKRQAQRMGVRVSAQGFDLRDVSDRLIEQIAGYVTKESLAWEMTGSDGKTRGNSRTPYQLLEAAAAGDARSADLFAEYELAYQGRRTIAWTPGFRSSLGMAELTEEQAAQERPPLEVLVEVEPQAWSRYARSPGALARLADVVRVADTTPGFLVVWLEARGVPARLARGPAQ